MESVFLLVVQVRLLLWCDVYFPDESERVVDCWQFETDSPIHANHLEMFAPLRLKDEETMISKESVRSDKSLQIPCFFGDAGVSLPQWRQEWFWIWIDFLPLLRGWRTYSSLKDYLCQFAIKLQFWQHVSAPCLLKTEQLHQSQVVGGTLHYLRLSKRIIP